jgi:hypothetical protein
MEIKFAELESTATEDEIAAERAAAKTTTVTAYQRKRPARKPFPEHLPRERVVVPGPTACDCCGGKRLRKLGETVTETLEVIPRQWKVIQHVFELKMGGAAQADSAKCDPSGCPSRYGACYIMRSPRSLKLTTPASSAATSTQRRPVPRRDS